VIALPLAHLGHALPLLPFFAPPLLLTFGLLALVVHDRMRERRNGGRRADPRTRIDQPEISREEPT
jgi:hypothetical protein